MGLTNLGSADIVRLYSDYLYNFVMTVYVTDQIYTNATNLQSSGSLSAAPLTPVYYKNGLTPSGSLTISALLDLDLSRCEQSAYMCVIVGSTATSCYTDTDESNNILCQPLAAIKDCQPSECSFCIY